MRPFVTKPLFFLSLSLLFYSSGYWISFTCAHNTHSDRPIAIAYSPTEPNPSHLADVYRPTPAHQAAVHHSTPVFVNVPDDTANANQQFQAPFIPSVNLENTQSTHNGWSIVTPPTVVSGGSKIESKGNRISASLANANVTSISRSDSAETVDVETRVESETGKFDFEHFKPDFQGGFLPIYKNSGGPKPPVTTAAPIASSAAPEKEEEAVKMKTPEKAKEKSDQTEFSLESLFYDAEDDDENDGE